MTSWKYVNSIQSSITILSGSLQSNRTYQFMVQMISRKNASQQATGYVLVQVENTRPQLIAIGLIFISLFLSFHLNLFRCVIWTLCIPNMEYQLINPTTQVALYGLCYGNCTNLQKIQWNIYSGQINPLTNLTSWILYNQTYPIGNNYFFGKNIFYLTKK